MRASVSITGAAARALVAAAMAFAIPGQAHAGSGVSGLGPGWTLVRTSSCIQLLQNGINHIYVYPQAGGLLWTNEKALVVSMEDACTYHAYFYAYSPDGATWQGIYYDPSINDN